MLPYPLSEESIEAAIEESQLLYASRSNAAGSRKASDDEVLLLGGGKRAAANNPKALTLYLPQEEEKEVETMAEYLSNLAIETQNSTVTTRQPLPSSPSIFFWTQRPTNSDVVSLINTTAAIDPVTGKPVSGRIDPVTLRSERSQLMAADDKVCGRGSGGVQGFKVSAYESPLETRLMLARDEHERMNKALHDERNEFFMTRDRNKRLTEAAELAAALKIQQAARRFFVRTAISGPLRERLTVRRQISAQVKGYLSSKPGTSGYIFTRRSFRQKTKERNYNAASQIINLWRRYVAIKKVEGIRAAIYVSSVAVPSFLVQCFDLVELIQLLTRTLPLFSLRN